MKRLLVYLTAWLALSVGYIPADAAITATKVGALITNGTTSPATINVTSAVSIGDQIEVLIAWPTTTISAITVADNAGTGSGNCAGAYTQKANVLSGERYMAYECTATIAMGTGTTCGAGGSTQCAWTISWTTASRMQTVVLDLTEAANTIAFDSAGSGVSGIALATGTPCTLTATETSTTVTVSAVTSCSSTLTIAAGAIFTGGGLTGTVSSPFTLSAGAGSGTVTGGSTVTVGASTTVTNLFSGGPTSPTVTGDEYVAGMLNLTGTGYGAGSSLGALQNGYASLSAPAPVSTNGANLWAAGQSLTSGTAQLTGAFNGVTNASTTAAGVVFSFKATPSGAATPCFTSLLGVGKC